MAIMEEFYVIIIKTYFTISLFLFLKIFALCPYCSFVVCTFLLNLFGAPTCSSLGRVAEQSKGVFPSDEAKLSYNY